MATTINLVSDDEDDSSADLSSLLGSSSERPITLNDVIEALHLDNVQDPTAPDSGTAGTSSASAASSTSAPAQDDAKKEADNNDDDFCEIVGETGDVALRDFPHARCHCLVKRDCAPEEHCDKCYCPVCEVEASECEEWIRHCKADIAQPYWKEQRRRKQQPLTVHQLEHNGQLLSRVTRVYPYQVSVPNLKVELTVYQEQSLAFMCRGEEYGHPLSLFMNKEGNQLDGVLHGGWLADEMGMGKSVVIAALMLHRKLTDGATLILAPNYLVHQWAKEIKKTVGDQLKLVVMYQRVRSEQLTRELLLADVIITAPGCNIFDDSSIFRRIRRLIVDEAHILLDGPGNGAMLSAVRDWPNNFKNATRRWLITGTPFDTHLCNGFKPQACRLIGRKVSINYSATLDDVQAIVMRHEHRQKMQQKNGAMDTNTDIPTVEKSLLECEMPQGIHRLYEVASHMEERGVLDEAKVKSLKDFQSTFALRLMIVRGQLRAVEQTLISRIKARHLFAVGGSLQEDAVRNRDLITEIQRIVSEQVGRDGDDLSHIKLTTAVADMKREKSTDPAFRAVLIADYSDISQICHIIERSGLTVISAAPKGPSGGGKSVKTMSACIEAFQNGDADVLVTTSKIGEVGINLQRAKGMYILDAQMRPQTYDQICGRHHRMDTKHAKLFVKTLVAKDTVDQLVYKYHNQENKNDFSCFFSVEKESQHVFSSSKHDETFAIRSLAAEDKPRYPNKFEVSKQGSDDEMAIRLTVSKPALWPETEYIHVSSRNFGFRFPPDAMISEQTPDKDEFDKIVTPLRAQLLKAKNEVAYFGGNIKWDPPEHRKDFYAAFSPEDPSTRYIGRDDRPWVNIKWSTGAIMRSEDSKLLLVEDIEYGLFRGEHFNNSGSCVLLPLKFTPDSQMDKLISSGVLGAYVANHDPNFDMEACIKKIWVPVSLLRSHERATHATVQTLEQKLSSAHEKFMQSTLTFELNMPANKYGALSAGTYHITKRDMLLKLKDHDSMTPFTVAMAFMSVPMHRCLVCGVTETVDRCVGKLNLRGLLCCAGQMKPPEDLVVSSVNWAEQALYCDAPLFSAGVAFQHDCRVVAQRQRWQAIKTHPLKRHNVGAALSSLAAHESAHCVDALLPKDARPGDTIFLEMRDGSMASGVYHPAAAAGSSTTVIQLHTQNRCDPVDGREPFVGRRVTVKRPRPDLVLELQTPDEGKRRLTLKFAGKLPTHSPIVV